MNEQDLIAERKKAAEHNDTARLAALETAALKRLDDFLTDENPVDSDDVPFFFAFVRAFSDTENGDLKLCAKKRKPNCCRCSKNLTGKRDWISVSPCHPKCWSAI